MNEYERAREEALAQAARRLGGSAAPGTVPGAGPDAAGCAGPDIRVVLGQLWDLAFEQGRLAALDEFSGRFCVCMK